MRLMIVVRRGVPWRAAVLLVAAGAAAALAVLSLVQDSMGLQAWQAWEARAWTSASVTVPIAILQLLLAADVVIAALRHGGE